MRDPTQPVERKYDTYLPDGMDTEVDKEDIIKGESKSINNRLLWSFNK